MSFEMPKCYGKGCEKRSSNIHTRGGSSLIRETDVSDFLFYCDNCEESYVEREISLLTVVATCQKCERQTVIRMNSEILYDDDESMDRQFLDVITDVGWVVNKEKMLCDECCS